jgi:hypothetical protein
MRRRARLIMGSALSLAAVAVAIDHTRHRVPSPAAAQEAAGDAVAAEAPCGLGGAPCGAGGGSSPCAQGSSPCSL